MTRDELFAKVKPTHDELQRIAWRRKTMLEQRANFDEKYAEDWRTAFLVMGSQYFDRDMLVARKRELIGFQPYQTLKAGEATLFWPRIPNRRYLIGADPATGRQVTSDDLDYCAAVVNDLETGEEVAAYRAKVTPVDFAFDLADLGRYYNDAMIAVERTGDGGTAILTLVGDCQYGAIYKHRDWTKRRRQVKNADGFIELEGFPTTPKTRPIALNFLNQFLIEHPELIWDEQFVNEALTFVRDEKGKPAAAPNAHDDTVSARWISHYVRRVLLGYYDPLAPAKREGYVSADRLTAAA